MPKKVHTIVCGGKLLPAVNNFRKFHSLFIHCHELVMNSSVFTYVNLINIPKTQTTDT